METKLLQRYAEVIVKLGVNLKKGDNLFINTQIDGVELAKAVMLKAYEAGAKKVRIDINSQEISKISYMNESPDALKEMPQWYIDKYNEIVDDNYCYLNILSEDPNIFVDVNQKLLSELSVIRKKALKKFYADSMFNNLRWCLCAMPNEEWAKTIFNEKDGAIAFKKLEDLIAQTMKLNSENCLDLWQEHFNKLKDRAKFLTEKKFKKFIYKNSLGTDFSISPADNYYFASAQETSPKNNIEFVANLPTEEVFSVPNRFSAEGIVYSALPLCHNGNIIKDFYLKFEKGKVVDFNAKQGYETLKEIINADEGSSYLGEIAFVPYDNNIRKTNTLFYNTLFDENASCHLALGDSYPLIEGSDKMTKEQTKELGLNDSTQHVDFMIGTKDMSIVGELENGEKIAIFKDGNFVI